MGAPKIQIQADQRPRLQGELQLIFDVLYDLGVIEPVLQQDWRDRLVEMEDGSPRLSAAVKLSNACGADRGRLCLELGRLDRKDLEVLALEVAREFADYQARAQELH